MDNPLEIKTLKDAIHVEKENHTIVDYFLFDEYEIHLNTLPAHCFQEWHYHSKIEETLVIVEGTLTAHYKINEQIITETAGPNDVIRVKASLHTFANETDEPVRFIVFRFVPDGKNKQEIIKQDKIIVEVK